MSASVELTFPSAGVALLQFANPPMNFISQELTEGLERAVLEAKSSGAKVVVLASTVPGYFIAHAGLAGIIAGARSGVRADPYLVHQSPFFRLMRELELGPMVSIAANNGQAWGGGAELGWACNLRIAAESATYGQPEVPLGISPGAGGTVRLARIAGVTHCLEMVLSGTPISARRALEWGAVNRVVPDDQLLDEAIAFASEIARWPAWALAAAKRSVLEGSEMPVAAAMVNEFRRYSEAATTQGTAEILEAAQARYDAGEDSYRAIFGIER